MSTLDYQQRFEQLLQAHRGIVYKVAGSYSRIAADQEDLVQEICLQLWRSFGSYDEQRKFSTWMYRVALNVAISQARRAPWSEATRFEPLDESHLETVRAESASEQDERLDAMHAYIAGLEPLNRALILLYLDEHSYAEMAEILGISETNVATKIGRIKDTLRHRMNADAAEGA